MKKIFLITLGLIFIAVSLPDNSILHYLFLFSGISVIAIAFKKS
ncbi:MAG: hypothetical protein VX176_01695 [Candidatus Neomarinimicrobiota bacterium]|nr:hypothetical protein [Candidatus Neomarinimicrobiota bacterium]